LHGSFWGANKKGNGNRENNNKGYSYEVKMFDWIWHLLFLSEESMSRTMTWPENDKLCSKDVGKVILVRHFGSISKKTWDSD